MPVTNTSRYRYAGMYNRNGIPTFYLRSIDRSYPQESQYYVTIDGDSIDAISHRFYGDSKFWWIIADANESITFPFDYLEAGTRLVIPPLQETLRKLNGE